MTRALTGAQDGGGQFGLRLACDLEQNFGTPPWNEALRRVTQGPTTRGTVGREHPPLGPDRTARVRGKRDRYDHAYAGK